MPKTKFSLFAALSLLCLTSTSLHASPQDINGLYVNTFGDSAQQALLFVHGGPGDESSIFEATDAQNLANQGYFVVVYDQRGQGRSDFSAGQTAYNYGTYSADLLSIIQTLQLKNVALLAHSHGGAIAAHFDQSYPGVTKKIILIDAPVNLWQIFIDMKANCTALYEKTSDTAGINKLNQTFDMILASATPSQEVETFFGISTQCGGPGGLYTAPHAASSAKGLYTTWMAAYQSSVLPALLAAPQEADPVKGFLEREQYIHFDFSQTIQSSSSQYYGIYGDEDGLFTPNTLASIEKLLGAKHGATSFELIHGASHNVFVDQQEAFNRALLKMLKE